MSDPNAFSWTEHRTFSSVVDAGGLALLLSVMQPVFSGEGRLFFWEIVGPKGQRAEGHGSSLLEAKRDCEAAARAMAKSLGEAVAIPPLAFRHSGA